MRFRKVLCRVVTGILFRVRRKRNPSAYAFAARAFSEYSHEANQVNNLVIILPGLARDQRLIVPLVGTAGIVELARVNALPQGLVQGGHRDLVPREAKAKQDPRSEEHTSELQSPCNLVCRLLLEKK